jgi:hypothetical protein
MLFTWVWPTHTRGVDKIGEKRMPPAHLELRRVDPPAPEAAWVAGGRREPSLAELLEDPMMALLWASDDLDPAAGRATVRSLQALVRGRGRHARPRRLEAGTVRQVLAA